MALKVLFLYQVALAVEHLEVHFVLAAQVGGSNDVQVRRVDGHPVHVVSQRLLLRKLFHSHVHVTGVVVCHTIRLPAYYRCDSHVTRAIHLVVNDSSDDQLFVLDARDVRLVR